MPKGVYKRTEYHKKIMSDSHLGNIPWNKNKKGLQIAWNKNLTRKDPRIAKYAEKQKNIPKSEKTKNKISVTLKRKFKEGIIKHPMKGEKHKVTSKQLMKEKALKQINNNTRKGLFKKNRIVPFEIRKKTSMTKQGIIEKEWKGFINDTRILERKNKKYKLWRIAIFERDNYTCQFCGLRGVYLEAHHVKSWKNFSKLRYVVSNGVTLCKECHNLTKKGRGK